MTLPKTEAELKCRFVDMTGLRIGFLTVLGKSPKSTNRAFWRCACDCGNEVHANGRRLRDGKTISCGKCFRRARPSSGKAEPRQMHGHCADYKSSGTHNTWGAMLDRCRNPNHAAYPYYGRRGIRVCERWLDFTSFLADMGARPDGMTIERIDNNGNYEPGNCRWVAQSEQSKNTRANIQLTFNGRTMIASEWAKETGIRPGTIRYRVKTGSPVERILSVGSWEGCDATSPISR